MTKYRYEGPVTMFGRVISDKWQGETLANTKAKAKSNLIYQFKKAMKMLPSAKIELTGDVKAV